MIRRVSKSRKSGFTDITQATFFGLTVLLAAGCSSTSGGVRARLIAPVAHRGTGEKGGGNFLPTAAESRF